MILASIAAAALFASKADWRDDFVLPEIEDAVVGTECPPSEEGGDRYFCLTYPREKARAVREQFTSALQQQGFMVGPAPEVSFGFLRLKGADPNQPESCESGLVSIFAIEGEPDSAKTAVMVIALARDTCGEPATEGNDQ